MKEGPTMKKIDTAIMTIDEVIYKNIELMATERGILSQNLLGQLRNLVEHVSLKAYFNENDFDISYENIQKGNQYVKEHSKLNFLARFHKLLQISVSHYTLDGENSERLMLKYYEFMLRMKKFLFTEYNMIIFNNIQKFPIDLDKKMSEYYSKISNKINQYSESATEFSSERFYIQKVKPCFVENEIYYEITFSSANDKASKTDRSIAFTNQEIMSNYAVKLKIQKNSIKIMEREMPIQIITNWEISVRPCEINNFSSILGFTTKIQGNNLEYRNLMIYLKKSHTNILDVLELPNYKYLIVKNYVTNDLKNCNFFIVLDDCRNRLKNNKSGSNVLRYLVYSLNNKIIKKQFYREKCFNLSNLNLKFGCIPFDQMPLSTSLISHNPRLYDLLNCIDITDRKHELLARKIKSNTENDGQLYTTKEDLEIYGDTDILVNNYNSKLYYKHVESRSIKEFRDYYYISGYENDTVKIIKKLKDMSSTGIENYKNSVESWLTNTEYEIDCIQKNRFIKEIFVNSRVAFIYGSAGTGKSTLINHIANFFNKRTKMFLANTNPAIDNLKRKVNSTNSTFKTISKFIFDSNDIEYDLLIIDECSTVSNSDMVKILNKAKFKLLVLVGDIYQIESIIFGNWFELARDFVPKKSVFELTTPYRTKNDDLLKLWNKVRNLNDDILEHITTNNYSVKLDDSVFISDNKDEIILCLNYDGLYGINNINKFLQSGNPETPVDWGVLTYKKNDPILFNESTRFSPVIFNNLKGIIGDIKKYENEIVFDIIIDKVINEMDVEGIDLEFISGSKVASIVRFTVNRYTSTDNDDDTDDTAVPFQIAYAVSIHKAQGLEFNSVKLIITDEVDEMISHNIFYTAITRAIKKLKIYWTPETENKVLKNLKINNNHRDKGLITRNFKN